jgi:hypothetical protein
VTRRIQLHQILVDLLGSTNVYFQPPSTVQMKFPCIIYSRDARDEKFADNILYLGKNRYSISVVDKNPDSDIPDKVGALPLTSFSQHYVVDNLNHDVYSTYY